MKTLFISLCIFFGLVMILFKDVGRPPVLDTPVKKTIVKMATLGRALESYYADCNTYPIRLEQLVKKLDSCPGWGPMPYVKNDFTDAWAEKFMYKKGDHDYDIVSFGADKTKGGIGINEDLVFPLED